MELENNFAKLKSVQNEEINNLDYNEPLFKELAKTSDEPEIPTPNNPPWGSLSAIGIWVFSVLSIFIFPLIFIVPYVLVNRQNSIDSFQTDSTAIFLNLIAIVPAHIFTLLAAWFVATKNGKFSLNDTLGLKSGGFRWWYYPLILIAFFVVAGLVSYLIPEGDNDLLRMLRSSRMAVYAIVILATFTAPLVEEVVYRGILYSALQRSVGVNWAVVIVTLMFAGVHVPQYLGSPGTILLICLLSLMLTLIRVKTNNLLPCIVMHTIFNGLQSVLLIAEPYLQRFVENPEQPAFFIRFLM